MKSMAKTVTKRNVGMEILEGLRQLKRGEVGRVITVPPVATIRERTGLSQVKFASLLGVSVRTLQEWEHGRRQESARAPGSRVKTCGLTSCSTRTPRRRRLRAVRSAPVSLVR